MSRRQKDYIKHYRELRQLDIIPFRITKRVNTNLTRSEKARISTAYNQYENMVSEMTPSLSIVPIRKPKKLSNSGFKKGMAAARKATDSQYNRLQCVLIEDRYGDSTINKVTIDQNGLVIKQKRRDGVLKYITIKLPKRGVTNISGFIDELYDKYKFDAIYPIHSHYTGGGVRMDLLERFIDDMQFIINKYVTEGNEHALTGFLLEYYPTKFRKQLKRIKHGATKKKG